jgi:putative membrane protein
MNLLANIFVGFVAFEHIGFLVLEMFLWTGPVGQKIFKLDPDFAEKSSGLAANQGLYNGFLAAGLIWALLHPSQSVSFQLKVFFLSCVLIAGLYGWHSASRPILFIQAIPALIALGSVIQFATR